MMRRRHVATDHFDLLPFITILMCTLGSLLYVTLTIVALNLGPGAGDGWIVSSDPSRPAKIPVLVEWNGKTGIVHYNRQRLMVPWDRPAVVRLPDGSWYRNPARARSPQLDSVLTALSAQRGTHYALFAVRPLGFSNFDGFADEFRSAGIDVGYEPIEQRRPVRLLGGSQR
jgi:hypothetical protein